MKQTRFNLEVDNHASVGAAGGPLSTFGRISEHSTLEPQRDALYRPEADVAAHNNMPSSLKKPHRRKHSRSSSPVLSLDDIASISRQLEGEVQMYDALTREYSHGNKEAVDLDEVREWGMRNLESINKALFSVQKKLPEDFTDKHSRNDMINALFYLKERITSIEKTAMTAEPFRSVSPKGKAVSNLEGTNNLTKFGQSMGTTSAASIRQDGRDNPFNQVVHVVGSASRHGGVETTPAARDNAVSACSSAIRKINEPSYFSNIKETNGKDAYRTYDNRRDENEAENDDRISRSDLTKEPFQSAYGRELS